jgi:hypothetical protein
MSADDGGEVVGRDMGYALMTPEPEFIERITAAVLQRNARPVGEELRFTCPEPTQHAHGDAHPSARWNPKKAVWRCDVCQGKGGAVDLARRLGVPLPRTDRRSIPRRTRATAQQGPGCTLAQYATAKRLPEDALRRFGLEDTSYRGAPAVRISYRDATGVERAVQFRLRLEKGTEEEDGRFAWQKGAKTLPYGLWRLERTRREGRLVLVEGASDCHTLWHNDIPALGIPGATWKAEWSHYLEGIPEVFLVVEPDRGGATLRDKLAAAPCRDRIRCVTLGAAKDPSGLYLADPGNFRAAFAAACVAGISIEDEAAQARAERSRTAWTACASLAERPDILTRFVAELGSLGAVGEDRAAQLAYLAVTSRMLTRPISLALKGPSAAGKSFTLEQVLRFFPPSAYYALTAMSERALAYSDEPLVHRMLVLYEAAGVGDDASYLMRSLLSEGTIRYETVEKTPDGLRARLIQRPGPTGLLLTTTAVRLHPENETRLLSVPVNDTREQTRRVLEALAASDRRPPVDFAPWVALQVWLEGAEHRVAVPFGPVLAEQIPPLAVRLRRDFELLLNLIATHALLHQATRPRDETGRVVALLADYAAVRALVTDLFGVALQATVAATVRETVEAVAELGGSDGAEVSTRAVGERLRLDRTTAYRRVQAARAENYLRNLEDRKGHPTRLVLGDPLPADRDVLPTVDVLAEVVEERGCKVARAQEGIDYTHTSQGGVALRCEPDAGGSPLDAGTLGNNGLRTPPDATDGSDGRSPHPSGPNFHGIVGSCRFCGAPTRCGTRDGWECHPERGCTRSR